MGSIILRNMPISFLDICSFILSLSLLLRAPMGHASVSGGPKGSCCLVMVAKPSRGAGCLACAAALRCVPCFFLFALCRCSAPSNRCLSPTGLFLPIGQANQSGVTVLLAAFACCSALRSVPLSSFFAVALLPLYFI